MSLLNFVTQVQKDIVFNPQFTGIEARYSRRIENKKEGDLEEIKETTLFISPQGNYVATEKSLKQIGTRINVIWAKTEDLKFNDKPFLPMEGDIIEYEANGILQKYIVSKVTDMQVQSTYGQSATYSFEDGTHGIIKINTLKL